jgi:hypothetical protein
MAENAFPISHGMEPGPISEFPAVSSIILFRSGSFTITAINAEVSITISIFASGISFRQLYNTITYSHEVYQNINLSVLTNPSSFASDPFGIKKDFFYHEAHEGHEGLFSLTF